METKRRLQQFFGSVLLVVGCCLSIPLLRFPVFGFIASLWRGGRFSVVLYRFGTFILFAGIVVYFIFSGLRLIYPDKFKRPRLGWGQILFGSAALLAKGGSYFHLVPNGPIPLIKPSNDAEALGMQASSVVISLICVYLIFRGIRPGFSRASRQPGHLQAQSTSLVSDDHERES